MEICVTLSQAREHANQWRDEVFCNELVRPKAITDDYELAKYKLAYYRRLVYQLEREEEDHYDDVSPRF